MLADLIELRFCLIALRLLIQGEPKYHSQTDFVKALKWSQVARGVILAGRLITEGP